MADVSRPPTFVQIRAPATPARVWHRLGVLSASLAIALGLGWAFHRMTATNNTPVVMQAAGATRTAAPPAQPLAVDLSADFERRAIDAAASGPIWTRQSLMDRISPFDPPAVPGPAADTPTAEAADAAPDGPREVSVRLAKGETVASALQKLGLASDAVAEVISALAAHISLKRLPPGSGMTAQIRPAGAASAKPVLEALTLRPNGYQTITIERDAKGKYAVEQRARSSAR